MTKVTSLSYQIINKVKKEKQMITDEQLTLLEKYIKGSNNIVFFGGAGVSTESSIPDFRSKDGLSH